MYLYCISVIARYRMTDVVYSNLPEQLKAALTTLVGRGHLERWAQVLYSAHITGVCACVCVRECVCVCLVVLYYEQYYSSVCVQ